MSDLLPRLKHIDLRRWFSVPCYGDGLNEAVSALGSGPRAGTQERRGAGTGLRECQCLPTGSSAERSPTAYGNRRRASELGSAGVFAALVAYIAFASAVGTRHLNLVQADLDQAALLGSSGGGTHNLHKRTTNG